MEQPACLTASCTFLHRGLFKTDRVLGTAQLKLDMLETACEVHEILEVRAVGACRLGACWSAVTSSTPSSCVR